MAKGTAIGKIGTTRTRKQLMRLASKQVGSEIKAAVSPLEDERQRLKSRRDQSGSQLGLLYGNLQKFVGESTKRMQARMTEGLNRERQIFAEAQAEMAGIKQQQATDAQQMAQQIGAPVPVDFTSGLEAEGVTAGQEQAGSQLWSMAGLSGSVSEAEAFTGKVFPLVRAQEENRLRAEFDEEINQIARETARIRGEKGTLISQRFAELLASEREFALQKAMANRDWQSAQASLALESKYFDLAESDRTGRYKGKPTLAAQQAAQDSFLAMQDLGFKQQQIRMEQRGMANQILDAAFGGGGGDKVISYTKYIPVSEERARELEGLGKDVSQDANGNWYQMEDVKEPLKIKTFKKSDHSQLNRLFEVLRAWGVPKQMAVNVIRKRSGQHKWVYGSGSGGARPKPGPGDRKT